MNNYLNSLAAFGVGGAHPGSLELTKEILGQLELTEKMKVLDAGCGTGQTIEYIAHNYNCQR